MQVQPYLMFHGRCEEAIEFYRKTLDAKVEALMRFSDAPPEARATAAPEQIMHSCFRVGDTAIMATDGGCPGTGELRFEGFSLAITALDDADAKRRFEALADGGRVQMPLARTFFASSFGVVTDKFGVSWMIVAGAQD